MRYNTLDKKAVIIENGSQERKAIFLCNKYKLLRSKSDSQNLTYPYYLLFNSVPNGLYYVTRNDIDDLADENSALSLGYFPLSIVQFKEALEEVFDK